MKEQTDANETRSMTQKGPHSFDQGIAAAAAHMASAVTAERLPAPAFKATEPVMLQKSARHGDGSKPQATIVEKMQIQMALADAIRARDPEAVDRLLNQNPLNVGPFIVSDDLVLTAEDSAAKISLLDVFFNEGFDPIGTGPLLMAHVCGHGNRSMCRVSSAASSLLAKGQADKLIWFLQAASAQFSEKHSLIKTAGADRNQKSSEISDLLAAHLTPLFDVLAHSANQLQAAHPDAFLNVLRAVAKVTEAVEAILLAANFVIPAGRPTPKKRRTPDADLVAFMNLDAPEDIVAMALHRGCSETLNILADSPPLASLLAAVAFDDDAISAWSPSSVAFLLEYLSSASNRRRRAVSDLIQNATPTDQIGNSCVSVQTVLYKNYSHSRNVISLSTGMEFDFVKPSKNDGFFSKVFGSIDEKDDASCDLSNFSFQSPISLVDRVLLLNNAAAACLLDTPTSAPLLFDLWSARRTAPSRLLADMEPADLVQFVTNRRDVLTDWRSPSGANILHHAFLVLDRYSNTRLMIRELIKTFPDLVLSTDEKGRCPLDSLSDPSFRTTLSKMMMATEAGLSAARAKARTAAAKKQNARLM